MNRIRNQVHHVTCGKLPLCIVGSDTAEALGHPQCGARSKVEAENIVLKCENRLLKAGLDPTDFPLTIVEGRCPESIRKG